MPPTEPDPRTDRPTVSTVEPSSWWPFVAIVLGAVGSYGVLVVHLLLEATSAGPWGLLWMAVPTAFIAAAGVALLMASGMPLREKLAVTPAALLGYSPRARSSQQSSLHVREPA